MTTDTVELALLAAVLADPGDDTPRLVYADWLEGDAGQPERAAFVRCQVELAKPYKCPGTTYSDGCYWCTQPAAGPQVEDHHVGPGYKECGRRLNLRRRERELWDGFGKPYERSRMLGLPANWIAFLPSDTGRIAGSYAPSDGDAVVRRGFIDSLTLDAGAFLRVADSLLYCFGPCGRCDAGLEETPGGFHRSCPACSGTGKVPPTDPCPECHGTTWEQVGEIIGSYRNARPCTVCRHPNTGKPTGRVPRPVPPTVQPVTAVTLTAWEGHPEILEDHYLEDRFPGVSFTLPG